MNTETESEKFKEYETKLNLKKKLVKNLTETEK